MTNVKTNNLNEGKFLFNIFVGEKEDLFKQEDFYQDGYLIDYSENYNYEFVDIRLDGITIIQLSLMQTDENTFYYSSIGIEYFEINKNCFVEAVNVPKYIYNLYNDPILFFTLFFLGIDIAVYFVLKKKHKII